MNKYMVVMAGGGGARFWPLSRANLPKQFLALSGQDAMINETIRRAAPLFPPHMTFIVTGKHQQDAMESILTPDIPRENILYEPMPKNTAPCVLYAALHIQKKHGDGIMCVFAADHHIADPSGFLRVIDQAVKVAESGKVVTIGIKPTFPSTGYGYVKRGKHMQYAEHTHIAYEVSSFVEKPNIDNARQYVAGGEYYWNSGMFVWKVSAIIELFRQYLPDMYDAFKENEHMDIADIYPKLESISVDYGIMEHVRDALVVPGDFGWSDVGSWDALTVKPDEQGNAVKGKFVGIDSVENIVYSTNKLIATIGVENLIIVEAGDAILICPKDRAQDVKLMVDKLKHDNMQEYL